MTPPEIKQKLKAVTEEKNKLIKFIIDIANFLTMTESTKSICLTGEGEFIIQDLCKILQITREELCKKYSPNIDDIKTTLKTENLSNEEISQFLNIPSKEANKKQKTNNQLQACGNI